MVSGIGKACGIAKLNVKIMDICQEVLVFVIKSNNFHHDFLIGLDLIKAFHLSQDHNLIISQDSKSFIVGERPYSNVKLFSSLERRQMNNCIEVNFNEFINVTEFSANLDHLDNKRKNALKTLIDKYASVFAKNKFDIGTVSDHEASIKLLEHKYISRKPYRCSIQDQEEIDH